VYFSTHCFRHRTSKLPISCHLPPESRKSRGRNSTHTGYSLHMKILFSLGSPSQPASFVLSVLFLSCTFAGHPADGQRATPPNALTSSPKCSIPSHESHHRLEPFLFKIPPLLPPFFQLVSSSAHPRYPASRLSALSRISVFFKPKTFIQTVQPHIRSRQRLEPLVPMLPHDCRASAA